MTARKQVAKIPKVLTPIGELQWVFITGEGKDDYDKKNKEFSAEIILQGEAKQEWQQQLDNIRMEYCPKGKGVTFGAVKNFTDLSEKEQTRLGTEYKDALFVRAKTRTTFDDGNKAVIPVYNAANERVETEELKIGNGSKGRLSVTMIVTSLDNDKRFTISAFLGGVQVTEYVPFSGDAGFDAVDGTFVSPKEDGESPFPAEGMPQ